MAKQYFRREELVFGKHPTSSQFQDLTDSQFDRIKVLGLADRTKSGNLRWFCECACGKIFKASRPLQGKTKSCGCFQSELMSNRRFKHGESNKNTTVEYRAYLSAKNRCTNPKNAKYVDYGGRGIEFRFNSYQDFLAEAGRRPNHCNSIGRINNEWHYEAGNIRWEDSAQQSINKRNNRFIEIDGQIKTLSEWTKLSDINESTIRTRLHVGWCENCAIKNPAKVKCQH